MEYFEIFQSKFNGPDDTHDDKVIWVQAGDVNVVHRALGGGTSGLRIRKIDDNVRAFCDFDLPEQANELLEHLRNQ